MAARNFELSEHELEFVRQAVASGEYASENDVVSAALKLLENDEESYPWRVEALQLLAQVGFDQIDRGEGITLDSDEAIHAFMDDILQKVKREHPA